MTIIFPPGPLTPGQTFIGTNGVVYTWDGVKWEGDFSTLNNVSTNILPSDNLAYTIGNAVDQFQSVYAGYYYGNGAGLTSLSVDAGNVVGTVATASFATQAAVANTAFVADSANAVAGANVTGTVANAVYATSAGSATTAITAGTVTTNAQPNITSVGTLTSVSSTGNVQAGNLRTAGLVSATGNITGTFILGNGSQLTGLPASYSNSNVVTLLASFGSNTISTTGNVTSGNLLTGGLISVTGNATVGNLTVIGNLFDSSGPLNITTTSNGNIGLSPNGTGIVTVSSTLSATGNITGSYILGNGSQLTGLPATYSNSNVVTLLANFGSNTISTTGNVTSGNLTVTSVYSTSNGAGTNVKIGDDIWLGDINVADTMSIRGVESGLNGYIVFGNADTTSALGRSGSGPLTYAGSFSATGNVSGSYLFGNGSQLTGFPTPTATFTNLGDVGAAFNVDLSVGGIQTANLSASNPTITLINSVQGKTVTLVLRNVSGTNRTVTTGVAAANTTTGSATYTVNNSRTGQIQYICVDSNVANVKAAYL